MSKVSLKLDKDEAEALVNLIDASMKANGVRVASPLAKVWPKFEEAIKEAEAE